MCPSTKVSGRKNNNIHVNVHMYNWKILFMGEISLQPEFYEELLNGACKRKNRPGPETTCWWVKCAKYIHIWRWVSVNLASQRPHTNTPDEPGQQVVQVALYSQQNVVFNNNGKALWSCAHWTMSLNACGVVYFACLSGWSYLFPDKKSVGVID